MFLRLLTIEKHSRVLGNYTTMQLLFRPGYLISDYISGKRQVSFPPMKMLFILAVAYAIICHWLFPEFNVLGYGFDDIYELRFTKSDAQGIVKIAEPFYDWVESHFSWFMLILSLIAIFPTWIMFRYSPRHTRHTLPEGFFVQVLFVNLQIVLFLLLLPCWFFFNQFATMTVLSIIVIAYYIVGYMQLFGYGLWGTLWRQIFVYGFVNCAKLLLMHMAFYSWFNHDLSLTQQYALPIGHLYILFGILFLGVGYIINRIATRKTRAQQKC
ncbi:MAG: DUF3667 domain-containing protein [Muribaculaceae bacterium]|nr:DUF3667 domain-containing protein [Muribaculaceae bacterium]